MLSVETLHSRETWQDPAQPVRGPQIAPWSDIDLGVIVHYTADDDLIDGDPGEHADQLDDYLRSIQNHYVTVRGYSIGYQWAVDWLGGVWELRGWDYHNAANLGRKYRKQHGMPDGWNANDHTVSILCLVDGNDPVTKEAAASVRAIVADAQRLAQRDLPVRAHQFLEWTSCAGTGINAQVNAGVFVPNDKEQNMAGFPPRIIKPTPKFAGGPWFAVEGGSARYADSADVEVAKRNGWPIEPPRDDGQYRLRHKEVMGEWPS